MSSNIYCGKEIVNNDRVIVYETVWNEEIIRFLSCHRVKQVSLVPGTSFMVQLSEFVRHALQFDEHTSLIFKNMVFSNILFIDKTLYEKKIQIEYNKETKQLILRSIKETSGSDDMEIIHLTTFVHTREYETYPEMKYKTDDVQYQQQDPGGERFYESISNDYQGEFRNLGTVYAINDNELVTTITYDTVPSLVEMRKCAMMDVATQMSMVLSSDEEKRNGFYLHSVGDCVFHPSFFKLTDSDVNNFYVECVTSEGVEWNESSCDYFIFNHQKECVIEFRQFRGGKFDTKLHRLYEDVWTLVDQQMEMDHLEDYEWITIDGDDCFAFHNSLDFTKRPNMVVITNSENEISSYLRSLVLEYPDWNMKHLIVCGDIHELPPGKMYPSGYNEIKYEGGVFKARVLHVIKDKRDYTLTKLSTGSYLITGGLGYVGKHIAQAFYDNGVRAEDIVLISSNKSVLPDDWSLNFRPRVFQCDVSSKKQVLEMFRYVFPDVVGIVHAAGVLSDKTLNNLTKEDFDKVFLPKVHGAFHIDHALNNLGYKPNFVVLCSSIASGFGSPGQANYSAANGALDKMAMTNKSQNYISIRWGAWVGGGMAMNETLQRSARMGILGLNYKDAVKDFLSVICNDETRHVVTVSPLDPLRLPSSHYFESVRIDNVNESKSDDFISMLKGLQSDEERIKHVLEIVKKMAITLTMDDSIKDDTPWGDTGLDSLSMVEMRNNISKKFPGITFNDSVLFDYPSPLILAKYITENAGLLQVASKKSKTREGYPFEPIAIVAVSCDFPGDADSLSKMWDFLDQEKDAMTEIPTKRFDVTNYPEIYVNKGAFVDTMHMFDPGYFGLSDKEVSLMDPQQRKCMEQTAKLLKQLKNQENIDDTGVFVGNMTYEYDAVNPDGSFSVYTGTGSSPAILANRISYNFGMQGPSMTLDTACSSSLVALDVACKALHSGDCSQAVVLGVNYLDKNAYKLECKAKMLSPNGRCATFSDKADGYARGEGCAGVIVKKLTDAVRDGDSVLSVIYATAVNQDGRTANITSPNGPSQERVIQSALERAYLDINDIDFIEAHGTGTALGDPIEIQSLVNVFGSRKSPLPITTVKSNYGHLEGCAGMSGIMKVIKCFQHRKLPKSIHCETLNPRIKPFVDDGKIVIANEKAIELAEKNMYYAGISGFGFGGTNAHVIMGYRAN